VETYRLYEGAIGTRAIYYSYCRASSKIRVRLCALDQLGRAEYIVGGSLLARHYGA
jgi:hypothetical protein